MISLYYGYESDFSHNGIATLDDILIDATMHEQLNGDYSLEMNINFAEGETRFGEILADDELLCDDDLLCGDEREVNIAAKHELVEIGMIVKANEQLFRIVEVRKDLDSFYILARHIFYDLASNFLEDVRPTDMSGAAALNTILSRTLLEHNFIGMSDVSTVSTAYYIRKNPVEALLGSDENSFVNRWGGEIVRDNFTIKMLNQRGYNNNVLVDYKKNLTGLECYILWDSLVTKIMPVGKDGLLLTEKYIDSPLITYYPLVKVAKVEFSDCETEKDLRVKASRYFKDTLCDIPKVNYRVDMLELSSTEEYKDYKLFERVDVGDTVIVRHKELNVNITARAISVTKTATYNSGELTWVTTQIELGNFKENSYMQTMNAINQLAKVIESNKSDLQAAIERASDLITGTLGGYLVINRDASGNPYELLIMDTPDIMTAKNIWRLNLGGFGHSSNGYNGPYETAITQDGSIVATFITTGVLNADLIKTGTITSKNGRISFSLNNDTLIIYDADGNKSIEFDDTRMHFYDWDNDHRVGSIYSSRRNNDPNKKGLVLSCGVDNYAAIAYRTNTSEILSFVDFDNGALGQEAPIKFREKVYFESDIVSAIKVNGGIWSDDTVAVMGDLTVAGSKNCIQQTQNYGDRAINAYETAEYYFGDLGEGAINEEGICKIDIDPVFLECVNTTRYYHVFLQKYGSGDIWVEETAENYFVVKGTPGLRFSWELKAKRKGYENVRLKLATNQFEL